MLVGDREAALRALNEWWAEAGLEPLDPRQLAAPARPTPARAATRPAPEAPSPVDAARTLASSARSLADLRAAIERLEGCALKATARSTVFCDGREDAPVLLIGERPGKEEDAAGRPFVGRSGVLLDRMLGAIGLSRAETVLIANMIFWRPPGDRQATQAETALCLPFVERLVAIVRPRLLVLCGGQAAQTLLRSEEGVTRLRGRPQRYEPVDGGPGVDAMVMLHPAYLLRRPQDKRLAWADLLSLETKLDALGIARGSRL